MSSEHGTTGGLRRAAFALALFVCAALVAARAEGQATVTDASAVSPSGDGGDAVAAVADAGVKPKAGAVIIEETDSKAEPPPPFPVGEELHAIGEYIRGHTDDVHDCYTDRLRVKPTLQGKVHARFQIGPSGRVIGATADGIPDAPLMACVIGVVRKWEFEKPASGGKLMVIYPFVFKPRAAGE